MLDPNLTAALKSYLERLTLPVELEASLDDSRASAQTRELLGEIAALSALVTVTSGDDARKPSFAVGRPGEPPRIRFARSGHRCASSFVATRAFAGGAS